MSEAEVRDPPVRDLMPEDVARGLAEGKILLVDVRELNETALERYPGAAIVPLSSFDPSQLPDPEGKQVVFACRSGRRSVTASQAAQAHGLHYDAHLDGGILAWKAAGLPTTGARKSASRSVTIRNAPAPTEPMASTTIGAVITGGASCGCASAAHRRSPPKVMNMTRDM